MAKTKTEKKPDAKAGKGGAAVAAGPAKLKEPKPKVRKRNQVKKGAHGGTLVVLVEDVAHVGKQGDLVEVRPGHARNYLLPYGLAVVPSDENLRKLDQYKIEVNKAREAKIADLKVLAEQLTRLPAITIEANAHEVQYDKDGQPETHLLLYGSIGPADISKALKGKNLNVEPEMVRLEQPIREANTLTPIPLNLGYGLEASIQVLVVALQPGKK